MHTRPFIAACLHAYRSHTGSSILLARRRSLATSRAGAGSFRKRFCMVCSMCWRCVLAVWGCIWGNAVQNTWQPDYLNNEQRLLGLHHASTLLMQCMWSPYAPLYMNTVTLSLSVCVCMCVWQRWLVGQVVTEEKIREAKEIYDAHLGPGVFNEEGEISLHGT